MQDITVHVHVRTLVQLLLEEANTHSGTVGDAQEKYNEAQERIRGRGEKSV